MDGIKTIEFVFANMVYYIHHIACMVSHLIYSHFANFYEITLNENTVISLNSNLSHIIHIKLQENFNNNVLDFTFCNVSTIHANSCATNNDFNIQQKYG